MTFIGGVWASARSRVRGVYMSESPSVVTPSSVGGTRPEWCGIARTPRVVSAGVDALGLSLAGSLKAALRRASSIGMRPLTIGFSWTDGVRRRSIDLEVARSTGMPGRSSARASLPRPRILLASARSMVRMGRRPCESEPGTSCGLAEPRLAWMEPGARWSLPARGGMGSRSRIAELEVGAR